MQQRRMIEKRRENEANTESSVDPMQRRKRNGFRCSISSAARIEQLERRVHELERQLGSIAASPFKR